MHPARRRQRLSTESSPSSASPGRSSSGTSCRRILVGRTSRDRTGSPAGRRWRREHRSSRSSPATGWSCPSDASLTPVSAAPTCAIRLTAEPRPSGPVCLTPSVLPTPERLPVARNTALLSACLAMNSAMLQLAAAVATLTFILVIGVEGLLGLGPALVLGAGALAALPAGVDSTPAVLLGLLCVGSAGGISLLARTAAGDMYPPERRARGIALVLFGAVFGAILGPAVFSPLFAGKELDADALVLPWLAASGFMVVGLLLVLGVRPDPRRIAELIGGAPTTAPTASADPLALILRRPGVIPSLLAAVASFSVMVAVMTLTGFVVVEHGHEAHAVFPIIGAHVVGMYALVLVVGDVIDRIGRPPALVGGLLLMGLSVISLFWITGVAATAIALFR